MAYEVIDLNFHKIPKNANYVFDTNVLLPVIGLPLSEHNADSDKKYLDYFNAVYSHLLKNTEYKVLIPSVQLSELFNRLLQTDAELRYNKNVHGKFSSYYKKVYRPSADCKTTFEIYKNELLTFKKAISYKECTGEIDMDDLLNYDIQKLDINDQVILRLAQENDALLVSHDGDYAGSNITQVTLNKTLIKAVKNRIGR